MCHKTSLAIKVVYMPTFIYQLKVNSPALSLKDLLDLERLHIGGVPEQDLFRWVALQDNLLKITNVEDKSLFGEFTPYFDKDIWMGDHRQDYEAWQLNLRATKLDGHEKDHPLCFGLADLGGITEVVFDSQSNILYLISNNDVATLLTAFDEDDYLRYRGLLKNILSQVGSRRVYNQLTPLPLFREFVTNELNLSTRLQSSQRVHQRM